MLEIYVDGDACPVKAEVEKFATRHGLTVHIVSNGGIRPRPHPLIHYVIVEQGADAADDWIADHITSGDIAVTADIPLASRCLAKGARVIRPNGGPTYNANFTARDRSSFLNALEHTIQAIKRTNAG